MWKGGQYDVKPRTIAYYFRQAVISMGRNTGMSIAAALTVAIALFILGSFLLLVTNANFIAGVLESNVEIAAYLDVDMPRKDAEQMAQQVAAMDLVADVRLVPKEEGLNQLRKQFGDRHDLLSALGGVNPLPDYLKIKVTEPEGVRAVAEAVAGLEGVEKVNYGELVVYRLFSVIYWVRWLGLGSMILLSLSAVFLVAITVRLTVFARRREINIMKYVGATDWFIRWPFFLEGMFLGLTGALVAVASLYGTYQFLVSNIGPALPFVPLVTDSLTVMRHLAWLLLAGTAVGALGSAISVHRFLKV